MNFNINTAADTLWTNTVCDVITGGRSTMPWAATNISLSMNDIFAGDLFFASNGDNLEAVFEMGAAAAVISADMVVPTHIANEYPLLKVSSVYEALRSLAKAARFRTHSLVIAVQGYEQRRSLSNALCSVSDLYEGGRHLSSSLAAMPDDCDFSIFGLSPSLRPDVIVINKASQLRDVSVMDNMPSNSIAMINADDPCFQDAIISVKAAGIKTILTFGTTPAADAHMISQIITQDGVQTTCTILGETLTVQTTTNVAPHMPTLSQNINMFLVGCMLVKLADMNLENRAQEMAENYMSAFLMTEVAPDQTIRLLKQTVIPSQEEAIFRVKNMVDTGKGRRALILEQGAPDARDRNFSLPSKLGGLDVVCASKKVSIFKNARKAVEGLLNIKPLSKIIPDVLTPGDYVTFKSRPGCNRVTFSEALRSQG
jgi:hypothetical protein